MIVEAVKQNNGYFIPIQGEKEKIKVSIEEELYNNDSHRKHLLLDKKTMEENWEYLAVTKKDWRDDFEAMEEAISNWNKK
jgi:hypothetical protein